VTASPGSVHDDPVADRDPGDGRAHGRDPAGDLVSEGEGCREGGGPRAGIDDVQIGVAESGGFHSDENLALAGDRLVDVCEDGRESPAW
jgi:hypothetical protein